MVRPATSADRSDLIALMLAEDAAWSVGPVSAEEAGELIDHYSGGVVFERTGRVAGYAGVGEGGGTILLAAPDDPVPALEALAPWLVERGHREIETYAGDTERISWLEARGFTYRRSSFELERGIDPPPARAVWPDGVTIARHESGKDDGAVHSLIYVDAAWAEVPGHAERSLEAWRAMFTPEYHGWVGRRNRRPIGWVIGRVFSDGRGWIQQLAVARRERGLGIGRALLLHSLHDLCALGATTFALGVQADNENALRLYRDVGFEVAREWRVYEAGGRL